MRNQGQTDENLYLARLMLAGSYSTCPLWTYLTRCVLHVSSISVVLHRSTNLVYFAWDYSLPDLPWVATHFFQLKSCITSKVHPKLHVNFKKQDDSVPELLSLFTYIKPSLQVCTWQRCVCANPHMAHHWLIIGGNAGKAFLLLDSCFLFWLVSSIVRAISLLTETSPDKVGSTWLLWQTRKEFTNRICRDACPCYLLQRASEAGAWWPFQLRQILTVVYRQLVPCDLPTNK